MPEPYACDVFTHATGDGWGDADAGRFWADEGRGGEFTTRIDEEDE